MFELILILGLGLFWGAICYSMAGSRGRDKWAGFMLGFLFGLLAVVGYLLIGNSDEKKAKMLADAINKNKYEN